MTLRAVGHSELRDKSAFLRKQTSGTPVNGLEDRRTIADGLNRTDPGLIIARLRREKGLMLSQLSRLSGVSASNISRIENGKISPTYGVVMKLAEALEIDWSSVIGGVAASKSQRDRVVTKRGTSAIQRTDRGIFHWLSADFPDRIMTPTLMEVFQESKPFLLEGHSGDEFIFVIEGRITFQMRGYEALVLEEGDSVYFDAKIEHGCYAVQLPARLLSIVTRLE